MEEEVVYNTGSLMDEPEDYYPPSPPPYEQVFTMQSGRHITLQLVGHSPTEAHHLWNGAKFIADYFEQDPSRVRGRCVLELGAGAGLPSLVAGILGARKVVMTDFPDADLVTTMQKNIDRCSRSSASEIVEQQPGKEEEEEEAGRIAQVIDAVGFVWGADPEPLLARLASAPAGTAAAGTSLPNGPARQKGTGEEQRNNLTSNLAANGRTRQQHGGSISSNDDRFDVLVLADLLFRHSEHGALVKTIKETMRKSRDSVAYVFFTSYRPWKQHLDMAFFDVARNAGLQVEQVAERKLEKPLFDGDPGDLDVQKTVKGFEVRWELQDVDAGAVS
ncbi:phytanoyl-CoA dioxygenase [Moelleriella libera RCEF 2490]|uniref:Protein N-terminal and lysine N-methyltransferase EFM7 n=1 Tax=Moelleriella libera RCEF 2490 TaxID=1081109 RepID=A0A166PHH1_9HYPO|nr:phytanoyl-CoA dioxygenase [Moelleriella libera RCEF 2490]